jgi:hypothetical protein
MIKIELQGKQVMELLKLIESAEAVLQLRRREIAHEVVRYNEWEIVFKNLTKQLELTKEANNILFMELLKQHNEDR